MPLYWQSSPEDEGKFAFRNVMQLVVTIYAKHSKGPYFDPNHCYKSYKKRKVCRYKNSCYIVCVKYTSDNLHCTTYYWYNESAIVTCLQRINKKHLSAGNERIKTAVLRNKITASTTIQCSVTCLFLTLDNFCNVDINFWHLCTFLLV
jgi:hypothetical protein